MRNTKKKDREQGFSLVELMATIGVIAVVFGFAVFQVMPALRNAEANSAAALVQSELRSARARAIAERGEVIVTFSTPGTIAITAPNITGFVPLTVALPAEVQFYVYSGVPKTPDNFTSTGSAIAFDQGGSAGNPLKIRFEPNGSAVDDTGSINNGAVYVAELNNVPSQRVITLIGATARVRTWSAVIKNGAVTAWN